ncbi:hypothetical protein MAR_005608 [Mya arenaria]|uniref:DUF3504 domain-containing protein n=1 Tax=Mya arenaria TaxID=6604 RepID=A0ABY7F467_MYAAR|nr:hypothetical protein MAR_005608 [Mya arenaria]
MYVLFSAIRKHDGTEYEPDELFSHFNQILISKRKHLKAMDKGNLKSKAESLTKEEFQRLRDSFLAKREVNKLEKDPAENLTEKCTQAYTRRRPTDILDDNSRFYLQTVNTPKTDLWYSHQPLGKNKLGQIMKQLTEKGSLEGRKAGRPPTEIANLGGWKSLQTINAYSTPTLAKQAQASDIISDLIMPSSSTADVPHSGNKVQSIEHDQTSVLADVTPVMNTSNHTCNTLDASRSMSSKISKQNSNLFAVLCGANIYGGTFNISIVSEKMKLFYDKYLKFHINDFIHSRRLDAIKIVDAET